MHATICLYVTGVLFLHHADAAARAEIKSGSIMNKLTSFAKEAPLKSGGKPYRSWEKVRHTSPTVDRFEWLSKIKPVGAPMHKNFLPLTEIPPPHNKHPKHPSPTTSKSGRRHLEDNPNCEKQPDYREIWEGAKVNVEGMDYEYGGERTVRTIIFPDHIDHMHFEVTTQVPYFTVGPIDAIGFNPSTIKSEHPPECEKIYQDHIAEQYTDEDTDFSEESLEMARMPLFAPIGTQPPLNSEQIAEMYGDISL